jgi:putative NADH-flavin reductase
MRLAVFGATGKTGQALVEQALAGGHAVTALVRDPAKLAARDRLTLVQGDVADAAAVAKTVAGTDAAISLLGNFNRKPNTEMSDATRTLCAAMTANGPKRLVVVTTIGVGDSYRQLRSFVFKMIIRFVAKEIWADRERQEAVVQASGLDWTIVRPGGLRDEDPMGRWTLVDGGAPQPKKVAIARGDVASALLAVVADPAAKGRTYCLFNDAIK